MANGTFFGSGTLWATPTSGDKTPRRFGILQDAGVDITTTVKELYGEYEYPVEVARGKGSISVKANYAGFSAAFWNAVFFGNGDLSDGHEALAELEAATVPAADPYTVNVANAVTFVGDLGVFNAATGDQFTLVDDAPAQGQYTVSPAGQYAFNASDAGAALLFTYRYTVAGVGETLKITNQRLGSAPDFSVHLYGKIKGKAATIHLHRVTASKLGFATKQEDFALPAFEAKAMANDLGQVMDFSFGWK